MTVTNKSGYCSVRLEVDFNTRTDSFYLRGGGGVKISIMNPGMGKKFGGGGWCLNANLVFCFGPTLFP